MLLRSRLLPTVYKEYSLSSTLLYSGVNVAAASLHHGDRLSFRPIEGRLGPSSQPLKSNEEKNYTMYGVRLIRL